MATIALTVAGNAIAPGIGGVLGGILGSQIDRALFAKDQKLEGQVGSRLDDLRIQTSSYGHMVPIIFGRARVAGNVIWATDLKEVKVTSSSGGGGGKGGAGTPSQTSVSYEYYATLAIAICEGEIDSIERIWADSEILSADELSSSSDKFNIHLGSETQTADSIIESYEGAGNVPAYRGTAYVVIEDLPLAKYGNRIPNFTFEVMRNLGNDDSPEQKIKEITLIPGAGEFVYHTAEQTKIYGEYLGSRFIQNGYSETINLNNASSKADVLVAVDDLERTFPNLEWVRVVCVWFADSIDASTCTIKPRVEYKTGTISHPDEWSSGGFTRDTAIEITKDGNGSPIYGGTPSDASIVALLTELNNRGYNIMFYPMIFVDDSDKPWRGRITTGYANIPSFFAGTNKYNAFVTHYANLVKDYVDAFIIGSEMVGLTQIEDTSDGSYPAVDEFVSLAASIKTIVGSGVKVSYAANWDEYHSVNGVYNMDPLWASSNIDFVGIDAYFPLTPDLDQSEITEAVIQQYWEEGEGWDYYYTDPEARTGYTEFSTDEFAWKNIEYWWSNAHDDSGTPTGWTAKMKEIWFTEFGFASVDGCANQPNVFVDPDSSESAYPRGSKERVDFISQYEAINATLDFLQERNAESGKSGLVPKSFLWTFDARPYPYFPDLTSVW